MHVHMSSPFNRFWPNLLKPLRMFYLVCVCVGGGGGGVGGGGGRRVPGQLLRVSQ